MIGSLVHLEQLDISRNGGHLAVICMFIYCYNGYLIAVDKKFRCQK